MTVDIGDDGSVGVISSSLSSSGHEHGYDYVEKRGGVDQRGVVGMKQSGMGKGQPPLMNGHQRSVENGQHQPGMAGDSFDSEWVASSWGMEWVISTQRSMSGMQQPGHQPQHRIKARHGVGRSQGHGFIVANQQQNTGLDPRRQQHPPQSSTPLACPSPSTTFLTTHSTQHMYTASTGST